MGTGKAPGASEAPGAWLSPVFSRPRLHPSTQLPQPQIAELDVWSARKRSFRIEARLRSSRAPPPQASPVPGSRASGLQRRVPLSLLLLQPQFSDPLRRVGSRSLVVPDPLSLCPASCVLCLESRSPVSGLPSPAFPRSPASRVAMTLRPRAHVSNQRLENSDLSVTRLLPCQHTIVSPEGDAGCQLDFGFPPSRPPTN